MEKVKITTISPGKSGTTNGKSWSKIGIQVEEKGDIWINGFTNKSTAEWTVGSIVNLELENDPKWGWQFKIPNATDNLEARVAVLEESVNALLRAVPNVIVSKTQAVNKITEELNQIPPDAGQPESIPPPEDDLSF